jgi:UrcA family protein
MSNRSKRTSVLLACAAAIATPLLAAAPNGQGHKPITTVSYDKTNLANPQAQAELYARLKEESRKICGSSDIIMTGSVERSVNNDECYEGTLAAAVQRLDDPGVTALHEAGS